MTNLCHFSLTYDSTDEIIRVLANNCSHCLQILDIEYSTLVTDESINDLLKCKKILKLHMFHTGLSLPGKARLLLNLKNLRVLVRGDFLCDVLDYIDDNLDVDKVGKLNLEEFW